MLICSVVAPHHFDADQYSLITLMWIQMQIWILILFDADADLDPFHPDADADQDPDPSFRIKAQTLEKCSNRLIFHTYWVVICKLMRIQIQLITLMRMRIRIVIFIGCRSGCGSRLPK
jgi:hypothetical protein